MNKTRNYIRILLLVLLLLAGGGMASEAWAANKNVTYHVITLPFGGADHPMAGSTNNIAYRIEAIKMTVTQDDSEPIKLPVELKSPLIKYEAYSYYTDAGKSVERVKIFPDNPSTYYTYNFSGKTPLAPGTTVGSLSSYDIYVQYIWDDEHDNLKEDYGKKLDLTGKKEYNVEIRSGSSSWLYALNMDPGRGNRGQAVPSSEIKKLSDLYAEDWAVVKRDIGGTDRKRFNFRWKLTNNDPYNIILQTAYNGEFQYTEDGYIKQNKGAQYFGSLESSSKVRGNWVTNEVNVAYDGKSRLNKIDKHGWFRGPSGEGRNSVTNGVSDHLFFSFTLLANKENYTLAASYVDVNDNSDWVPNGSGKNGKYLLMHHGTTESLPYAGPNFYKLEEADQIRFHEIRDYNFKVITPLSNTILSTSFRWSDYGKDSLLIDYVPDALKRKYVTFEGTYAASNFTNKRTTFFDLYSNDEPEIQKPRDVWLKYELSSTIKIPFKAGTGSSTFADQEWYNIFVDREKKSTVWHDTSGAPPLNQFSTASGHTMYARESHFSFIGDPYELLVINRKASEATDPPVLNYLTLGGETTSPLISYNNATGIYDKAVPSGKALIVGNYYKKGEVVSIYEGPKADASTYEKIEHYSVVHSGETLTEGGVYYTTATGDGIFVCNENKVADTDYYVFDNSYYEQVPEGTPLTIGKTYYNKILDVPVSYEKFVAEYLKAGENEYYERSYKSNWEIIYDNNLGDFADCFRLRQFNTYDKPVTIGRVLTGKSPLNGDGSGGSTMAKLWVEKLPMMNYTYYIVDNAGRIAVKATKEQPVGTPLDFEAIPENIRSSFLKSNETGALWFKTYKSDEVYDNRGSIPADYEYRTDPSIYLSEENIEDTNSDEGEDNEYKNHIFVFYDTAKLPAMNAHPLDGSVKETFNVRLNEEFIYYDSGTIKSKNSIAGFTLDPSHLWAFGGQDPYAMTIRNTVMTGENNNYVKVDSWFNGAELGWDASETNASRFIIKSSSDENPNMYYEVMATTGNAVDASVTYYNIGRINNTTVRMYSNTLDTHDNEHAFEHGNSEIRFQLILSSAHDVYYHLIDKSNKKLLIVKGHHGVGDTPHFPDEYSSPLVKKYYYFHESDFTPTNDTYVLDPSASTVTAIGNGEEGDDTKNIYVIYDVDEDLVDMQHTTMYLIKFAQGDQFRQENGSDNLLTDAELADPDKSKAVYPYCNGDCNFNVYGQYQYDVQQEGAASTRTRWAWYVQSTTHDPYHVMILSRQTETYKGLERSAYFATMQFEGYPEVVTALVWPNISGVMATEYMMLGNLHQYRLVTTKPFGTPTDTDNDNVIDVTEEDRRVVNSLEQYWKTYDLIRRNLLKDKKAADPSDPADVPATPSFVTPRFDNNRTFLTTDPKDGGMGWHAYNKMAKAKRWNGYNKEGEASKGWESREHWFQTVKMGAGYFDLIPVTIDPALVLLDQHGWEIMRKPMPSDPNESANERDRKLAVLRSYDSPMVKEYLFWATAKKRSGYHQYYALDKRIGGDYTSTSLASFPTGDLENVKDNKGNLYDQYVTYIVKDEYAQSYQPGATPQPFLIRQGRSLAKKGTGTGTIDKIRVENGTPDVAKYIMANAGSLNDELWYVRPNVDIDREMGYPATHPDWKDNPNAYEDPAYSTLRVADLVENTSVYKDLLTDDAKKDFITKYGRFTFSNGFDPYNMQISSCYGTQYYFTIGMTSSSVEEGEIKGVYSVSGGPQNLSVTQATKNVTPVAGNSYDNSHFAMTNQTFMAVQDADGNMQLMPRFDHSLRIRDFSALVTPVADDAEPNKLFETYTQLYRPFVYNYRIIDNQGREALRYQWAGELVPQTPEHLKSPLATDFRYYRSATYDEGTKIYSITESTDNVTSPYEITSTSSMAGAGKNEPGSGGNINVVYVRYVYDEEADVQHVLLGKWFTMELNGNDALYTTVSATEGIYPPLGAYSLTATNDADYETQKGALTTAGDYYFRIGDDSYSYKKVTVPASGPIVETDGDFASQWGNAKPLTSDALQYSKQWHWKFLKNPYSDPDPYAVQLFNRSQKDEPLSVNNIGNPATANAGNTYQYFVLLSHTDNDGNADGYALTVARTGSTNYPFLNGRSMSTTTVAKIEEDKADYSDPPKASGFTSTSGTFHANDSRIVLTGNVTGDYTYIVYTNGKYGTNDVKYGSEAIREVQYGSEVEGNGYEARVPEEIRSPLLPLDWFLYYEAKTDMGNPKKEIKYLYGLYDNEVYVRYKLYDPGHTDYKVPNARNNPTDATNHTVARDPDKSNDSSLGLDGKLPYNIIWYDDNMMKSDESSVKGKANQELQQDVYEWRFEGDDPYAIKIKNQKADTYIDASGALSGTAQTFMLLPKSGYEYGVLAKTGEKTNMLSMADDDDPLSIITSGDPQKFIIFTLATLKVVYHLVIANIGDSENIAWRDPSKRYSGDNPDYYWLDTEKGYENEYSSYSPNTKSILGTTKRDLTSKNDVNPQHAGEKYQLGTTYNDVTYSYDAGSISLGDTLRIPNVFYRPNVVYTLFVSDITDASNVADADLNNHFKGMEIKSKRMGLDLNLIGKTVYINVVYSFDGDLESNSGDDFVKSLDENKWYTLETNIDKKPYLAQYTNAWGFELKEGRGSHYTNDFLWSPIGDPYGFQLFNRYMDVNSGDHNLGEKDRVITTIPYETVITKTTDGEGKETITVSDTPVSAFKDGKQIVMGNYVTAGLRVVVPGGVTRTTTESTPGEGQVSLSSVKTNSIYELLSATTPGYFRIHPVANTPDSVFFHPENADDDRDGTNNLLVRLSTNDNTEFTFNLTKELITPYFNRAGYVGGLKKSVYDELVTNNYPATTADGKENGYYNLAKVMLNADAEASAAQLRTAQTLVYNSANIVSLVTGYYRLHSPLGISGIDPVRYASGYTHQTELYMNHTDKSEADAIPMHFYEKNSDEVRQFTDFKDGGFTSSPATQGDLTIPPVERDPASIFYFTKISREIDYPIDNNNTPDNPNDDTQILTTEEKSRYNLGFMSTQELYVKGTVAKGTAETTGSRAKAVMTSETIPETSAQEYASNGPTPLFVMDLGGGVLLIHDNHTAAGRSVLKYLSYDYSNDTKDNPTIYDLKLTNHTHTDHAKWCMQPVQSDVEKGVNEMGLKFTTSDYTLNNGGDGYYYTTFYAPFDVLLTDDENDAAYICEVWDTKMLHLRKVGRYNNTQNIPGLDEKYQGNNQFVPANTPVVIRTKNTSVTMALPPNAPSPSLTENLKIVIDGKVLKKDDVVVTVNNIFKGVCLEQILTHGGDDVYVFGLPFESTTVVTKDKDGVDTDGDGLYAETGKITVAYPSTADTGVGFYINVNYNREVGGSAGEWIRNNKCVYSNKIYIRPDISSSARQGNMAYELGFVPVVFDDDDEEDDEPIEEALLQRSHDNRVYDLLGRCVASGEEVANGTWRSKVASGIYILNGRKIRK
jgi:hypothetical protein